MSSCAYNPFIYWWMNPKFNEGYRDLFGQIRSFLCWRCEANYDSERKGSNFSSVGSRRLGNGGSNNIYASTSKRASTTTTTQVIDLTSFHCDNGVKVDSCKVNKAPPLGKIPEAPESSSRSSNSNSCLVPTTGRT